ncbi:MAG: hypothetical protein KGH89_06420 [Thaumarchaeota archaeon]|nr:hypothetical protein [Nitrososphaerota archaeon]
MSVGEQHKIALISCIEVVLMRRRNTDYNLVVAKLNAHYDVTITDCYEHPEYLKTVLKEVYKEDYNSIIDEIKLHLGDDLIAEKDMADFFKIMES